MKKKNPVKSVGRAELRKAFEAYGLEVKFFKPSKKEAAEQVFKTDKIFVNGHPFCDDKP